MKLKRNKEQINKFRFETGTETFLLFEKIIWK